MKYVIYACENRDYYIGETYVYQGSLFPCVGRISEAKRYSSRKRAENVAKSLDSKCDDRFESKRGNGLVGYTLY